MVNNWLDIIQQLAFPPTCLLCGSPGDQGRDLCRHCKNGLALNTNRCPGCASPVPPAEAERLCGRCLSHPPAFDTVVAPYLYDEAARYLITGLKFGARHAHARLLGQLLADHLPAHCPMPERIIPIPLHPKRYRERGFNQAIEIGRRVAAESGVPLDLRSCRRRRDTPHQAGLTSRQRRRNIKNAFELAEPMACRHIAIVDDVMTTGSTAHELAVLLKRQGVERVDVWVCARA